MAKIKQPSYIGKDCSIEDTANLGPYTILSERVSVRRGAEVTGTIVFEQTSLGENCTIEDSLIGEGVTVGKGTRIGKGSLIAGQVVIPDRAIIRPGSVILNYNDRESREKRGPELTAPRLFGTNGIRGIV